MRFLALSGIAVGMFFATLPQAADPCRLVTRAEAAALLGAGGAEPMGGDPEPDEDMGAQRITCVYQNGDRMLIVMILEFPNADAAGTTLTREMVEATLEDETATIAAESGLGDRAYWGMTEGAATFVVLRGARVLGVVFGGGGVNPADQRAALRTVTAAAVGRL